MMLLKIILEELIKLFLVLREVLTIYENYTTKSFEALLDNGV